MFGYVRTAIVLLGVAGLFSLFAAKPLLPPELKPWFAVLAVLLVGATWGLILLFNKIFCGDYFPGRSYIPPPRAPLGEREQRDRLQGLLSVLCLGSVGVLMVFLIKEFGWSKNTALLAGAVMSLILIAVFTGMRARYGGRGS